MIPVSSFTELHTQPSAFTPYPDMHNTNPYPKILLYDDECGFCSRFIEFIWKNDRNQAIYFCSLRSEKGKNILGENGVHTIDLETVYYIENGVHYKRSQAIFQVLRQLKFPLCMITLFGCLPKQLTDYVYDQVARRRHILSKKTAISGCTIPPPVVRDRFIR